MLGGFVVTDDQLDNETIAAFLDGTLPDEERARVVRVLASSPELYSGVLEAAKVSAELERSSTPLKLEKRVENRWRRRILIAAPVLAAASIVGILVVRRDNPPDVIALA